MKRIPISRVRELTEAAGGRGTIVLSFDGAGAYSGTSYGETRAECAELGKLLDAIADRLNAGTLPRPKLRSGMV